MLAVKSISQIEPQKILYKKNEFTNEVALNLLKSEFRNGFDEKTTNHYLEFIKKMCKKLNIQIKDLPINSMHKGSLTQEQSRQVFDSVINTNVLNQII